MLPLQQAEEVKEAIVEYLRATFTFSDSRLDQAFEDYLSHPAEGMFKGPYLNIRLPFETLTDEEYGELKEFLDIYPAFKPYEHQRLAFQRLSSKGQQPQPVLLTTGTGSGKTESFLYPILDYCYRNRNQPGIKAVILYPMNALATDQAKRLAEIIYSHQDENGAFILRDVISAGLFIGEGKQRGLDRATRMGPDTIIEHRDTILQSPPDILFTNFKMLDFSLMQARFHGLWRHNLKQPDLLRYLVLDELHTYDGAKGSDVGNLIRRLKLKLSIGKELTPVGTSATISGGARGKQELLRFFETVFGVKTDVETIIEEHRLLADDFFVEALPDPIELQNIEQCRFLPSEGYEGYLRRQIAFWGIEEFDPIKVAASLQSSLLLHDLVQSLHNQVRSIGQVILEWKEKNQLITGLGNSELLLLLGSLLGLISYAKVGSDKKQFPFLYLQITHWLRSLHQSIRLLQVNPIFKWESDYVGKTVGLPPYFCRECGSSGWIGWKKESNDYLEDDLSRIRQMFVANNHNKNIYFISEMEGRTWEQVFAPDYRPQGTHIEGFLNPETLLVSDKKRSEPEFKIIGVRRQDGDRIEKVCPHCSSQDSLALIGTGLPTLESVAASQLLSTNLAQTEAAERKLLAFSNQVQDAAHQAGFIENRNFRFSFRQAIQQALKGNEDINLVDFYQAFERFWMSNIQHGSQDTEEAFYYRFAPPDVDSRIDITKDYRLKTGAFSNRFKEEFSNRLSWEIWSEYSYAALIGRTLEKSASSIAYIDAEILREVYHQMGTWLDTNSLSAHIHEASFIKFVLGILQRMRTRGGVDHQYLKKFRTERSNYYLITQNANKRFFLMKNFGRFTRLPRFLVLDPGPNRGVFDVVKADINRNWFTEYFLKNFEMVRDSEKQLINDFYEQLINYLDANEVLSKKVASGIINYGINPDQLFITSKTAAFQCANCGHSLVTASATANDAEEMVCLQYRCTGRYRRTSEDPNYYNLVYNRSISTRLFARDHTGLIDREIREQLEEQFKRRRSIRDCNVLVATSTLEMGIDIGDLNATFNATLPPETSNYLQRIGRAGRKSGSSYILNLTGRDGHDLYYFAEPMELMEGVITTPSCFLEAKDILMRHFMAFCFDSWASLDPENNRVPQILRALRIQSTPEGSERFIFNKVILFIENNLPLLAERFLSQYEGYIGERSLEIFREGLMSVSFLDQLRRLHRALRNELDFYADRRRTIDARVKRLPGNDPEASLLKRELKSISGLIHRIYERNTVEHLTNLGILPNYAFPETGVRLSAEVYRKVLDDDGSVEYRRKSIPEIVRPASSALRDLAPSNAFYTQGYQLPIQGLNLADQMDFEAYRFCSTCDHFQLNIDAQNSPECPKCGDTSFNSVNNVKNLYRLSSVISVDESESIKIRDSSDDRDRKFYHISLHVTADPDSSQGAYILKRVPFGIEYFTSVRYTEINAGVRIDSPINARTVTINERDLPAQGFIVCKHCGYANDRMLTPQELQRRTKSYHFNYCSHRDQAYDGHPDDTFEETYLYRQYYTEALKILLPVQEFRSEERVSLFKAGLYLGLKQYYQGRPDHIVIQEYDEFNEATRRKNRYLILFETIPGGTGYLSKLFDTRRFKELISKAYEKIAFCSCKLDGKDGCYKCIYTYGNQYERAKLSREEAESLFLELIEKSEEWHHISTLSGGADQSNIEESDLEFRFVDILRELADQRPDYSFEDVIKDGVRRYHLEINKDGAKVKYEIIPQNGDEFLQHVSLKTIPDFVFRCLSSKDVKPVAVYLDGYEFHASEGHPRLSADVEIREAIRSSAHYELWVLTWKDLDNFQGGVKDGMGSSIDERIGDRIAGHPKLAGTLTSRDLGFSTSFERFLFLLSLPLTSLDIRLWASASLFLHQSELLGQCFEKQTVYDITTREKPDVSISRKNDPGRLAYMDKLLFSEQLGYTVFIDPSSLEVTGKGWYGREAYWDKDLWQSFWEIYNVLQFTHVRMTNYEDDLSESEVADPMLENFSDELHPIVLFCQQEGIEFNTELDFDLMNDGRIAASAEFGSSAKKFVINPFDEESSQFFRDTGYQVYTVTSFKKEYGL